MKTVRLIANFLYYLTKFLSVLFLIVAAYAAVVVILWINSKGSWVPIHVSDGLFTIYYPFTKTPFLLGDYTSSYLITSLLTVALYGVFMWLLSGVFNAFRQERIFTKRGVMQLSRFYITNLTIPVLCVLLLAVFGKEVSDVIVVIFLHIMIGVFAFFMAAIFKQGLVLQEEQDLTL